MWLSRARIGDAQALGISLRVLRALAPGVIAVEEADDEDVVPPDVLPHALQYALHPCVGVVAWSARQGRKMGHRDDGLVDAK